MTIDATEDEIGAVEFRKIISSDKPRLKTKGKPRVKKKPSFIPSPSGSDIAGLPPYVDYHDYGDGYRIKYTFAEGGWWTKEESWDGEDERWVADTIEARLYSEPEHQHVLEGFDAFCAMHASRGSRRRRRQGHIHTGAVGADLTSALDDAWQQYSSPLSIPSPFTERESATMVRIRETESERMEQPQEDEAPATASASSNPYRQLTRAVREDGTVTYSSEVQTIEDETRAAYTTWREGLRRAREDA